MLKFKSFLKEFYNIEPNQAKDAHEPTGDSSSSVQNPVVVSEINAQLIAEEEISARLNAKKILIDTLQMIHGLKYG
jgi:hypothetical protein